MIQHAEVVFQLVLASGRQGLQAAVVAAMEVATASLKAQRASLSLAAAASFVLLLGYRARPVCSDSSCAVCAAPD